MYRTGESIGEQGAVNPGLERAVRDGMRELQEMRQELREVSPETQQDIDKALEELRRHDPAKIASDPLLAQRIQSTVLPLIEQLELQLRRKLEGKDAGQVRSSANERVPAGYADAVADYFRRLSKTR
jgi:hypothetical protein